MGLETFPQWPPRYHWVDRDVNQAISDAQPSKLTDYGSDLSFAALQYKNFGHVTNSMIVVVILHCVYVVDFFINESW